VSWLESHQSLRDHPKTRKLARRIGGLTNAIGTLHCLWWWCLDYAPDGDLSGHDAEDVAIACEWEGDPKELIDMLVASGFLDREKKTLRIHDWTDWGGTLVQRRAKDAERKRRGRTKPVQRTSSGHPEDGARTYIHTYKRSLSATKTGQGPVDNSKYCECGAEMASNGDGSVDLHCPVCQKVPS
jgi:hypothetical protein